MCPLSPVASNMFVLKEHKALSPQLSPSAIIACTSITSTSFGFKHTAAHTVVQHQHQRRSRLLGRVILLYQAVQYIDISAQPRFKFNSATAMSTAIFSRSGELPKELQIQIWKYATSPSPEQTPLQGLCPDHSTRLLSWHIAQKAPLLRCGLLCPRHCRRARSCRGELSHHRPSSYPPSGHLMIVAPDSARDLETRDSAH